MKCGLALRMGGAVCCGTTNTSTLMKTAMQQHPSTSSTKTAIDIRVVHPQTTRHRHSPMRPHASFDHTKAPRRENLWHGDAPDVAHLLSLRVGWGVGLGVCGVVRSFVRSFGGVAVAVAAAWPGQIWFGLGGVRRGEEEGRVDFQTAETARVVVRLAFSFYEFLPRFCVKKNVRHKT